MGRKGDKATGKAFHDRQARWALYALIGSCRWIETKMSVIILHNDHVSAQTRSLAANIRDLSEALKQSINADIKEFNTNAKIRPDT